jgi:hypothetical protein
MFSSQHRYIYLIHDRRLKIVTLSALIFEDLVKLSFVETLYAIYLIDVLCGGSASQITTETLDIG